MNNRKPGENFTEKAEPFVEQIKEMATKNYQKLLTLTKDFGQKLQKTFNPTPGIGGNSAGTKKRVMRDDNAQDQSDDS